MENPCKTRSYSISCNHLLTVSLVKPLACRNSHQYPSFYVRQPTAHCIPPSHTQAKPAAHATHINPFSSYHTDTQSSPSVGQWKTVAMAAHPEPCCRMIRAVTLLNQPSLCPALLLARSYMEFQNGTTQTSSTAPLLLACGTWRRPLLTKTSPRLHNRNLLALPKVKLDRVLWEKIVLWCHQFCVYDIMYYFKT